MVMSINEKTRTDRPTYHSRLMWNSSLVKDYDDAKKVSDL